MQGWADDAHQVMSQARVCIAPLRFGAGIKGKLADAMLNGTPNVTTSIGIESMHGLLPWSGAVSDDAATFAHLAVNLYQQSDAWQQAVEHGDNIIRSRYNKALIGSQLLIKMKHCRDNLAQLRQQNFIGSMLRHHSHKSTKYMAQWIEAKNKH